MTGRRLEAHGSVGPALHERRASLGSDLTAPSAARRLVREVLEAAGRTEWRDAAELAVSEVVTNAALHAHTEIDLLVEVLADRVCVEVRDRNPAMPVQREYDDHATTGRGMGLVASITLACGVHSLGKDGKISWFCVGDEAEAFEADRSPGTWDLGDRAEEEAPVPAGHADVLLSSMPVTLWLAAREHHDAILRELVLYMVEHPDVEADLAAADEARSRVSSVVAATVDEALRTGRARPAVPAGHPSPLPWAPDSVDIAVAVPHGRGSAFSVLQDVLDLAEALAVRGELLVRPGLPEIVAVRDWACEQVTAQLVGVAPSPWGGTSAEHFETVASTSGPHEGPDWDATVVSEAATGAVAADDGNRIVAVSRPFAELVGRSVDDLVGRRVVTVIPPHLREAHVAGFSRHLSTGQAHALGVPLELPVLRADGSEVLCHFLVERAPASGGRAVYVAWIDPLG